MAALGKSFRKLLTFSKIKSATRKYSFTPKINDLNGKDLYSPKYGTSYYEPQEYENNFFHKPQCIPYLKESEKEYTDKEIADEERKKHFYDCENELWTNRED